MTFIDSYTLWVQWNLSAKRKKLLTEKEYYEDKILKVKNEKSALINNTYELEKLAREKYLMKKDDEDVYIIQKK